MNAQSMVQPPEMEYLSGRHVLLALSGGADSMALLDMLCRARDAGLLRLSAAHYCHGIRGNAAIQDAEFCRHACEMRNVAYYFGSGDVPGEAARTGEGLETAARRMRYAFLNRALQKSGADVIALAHHADDQAETILMHLLRGAGISGMKGMARESGNLVRPLLGMKKADIRRYLQQRNISWREDATNACPDNPRNILRLEAIPAMLRAYPGGMEAVCRHGEIAREEDALLDRMTQSFLDQRLKRYPFGEYLALNGGEETSLLRRAFRYMLGNMASWENIGRAMELALQNKGAMDISAAVRMEKYPGGIYLLRSPMPRYPEIPLSIPGKTAIPGIGVFTARPTTAGPVQGNPFCQALRPEALHNAVARTRRPGDRIHPLGMEGSKSISDYMIDYKLDRPLRDHTPLLAVGSEVLWIVGLGISRLAALNAPGEAIELTFTQEEDDPC